MRTRRNLPEKLEKFIRTMDGRFRIRAYSAYSDFEKVQVFASFLASPADDWHDGISISRPHLLSNYRDYVEVFRAHYQPSVSRAPVHFVPCARDPNYLALRPMTRLDSPAGSRLPSEWECRREGHFEK